MRRGAPAASWLVGGLLIASGAAAGETLYVEAGLVMPVDGEPIPNGRIVVKDGRIAEVGADVERPAFSRRVDARGLTVSPGFVVPWSAIGLPAPGRRASRPGAGVRVSTSAKAKAVEELRPRSEELAFLLRQGITTLGLQPVSDDSGVRGQLSAVSTQPGSPWPVTLSDQAAVVIDVDAHGPWREKVGEAFAKAVEKADEAEAAAEKRGDAKKEGERGASKDPLVLAVQGKRPVFLILDGGATWTAARDVLPIDRLDATVVEYGRAWELAEAFGDAGLRVVTSPVLVNRPRTRLPVNRAAELERFEVPFAFRLPSDGVRGAALLRDQAIEMVRTGAGREAVMRALTLEGARALGLESTVGAIANGRRADLLFWTGDPLDPLARLVSVRVAGEEILPFPVAAGAEGGP
jgi:hypothetical protein